MSGLSDHALGWLVTAVLVVAAVIDGRALKVPNWLTFPFVITGVAYGLLAHGWSGLGTAAPRDRGTGMALLLPLYAIGGMGAGDVKLFMGVGAWMGPDVTLHAFLVLSIVGAIMAVAMVLWSGEWRRHWELFRTIIREILVIRDPVALSEIAAKRKPSMLLLPYGIPIAVGSIGYFIASGHLF
ncbi:MAG: prepilin peptidase [Isosphaeraceae bacterium]